MRSGITASLLLQVETDKVYSISGSMQCYPPQISASTRITIKIIIADIH